MSNEQKVKFKRKLYDELLNYVALAQRKTGSGVENLAIAEVRLTLEELADRDSVVATDDSKQLEPAGK